MWRDFSVPDSRTEKRKIQRTQVSDGEWILCLQSDETISVWTKQKWKDATIGRLSNYHVFLRLSPFSQSFFFFFVNFNEKNLRHGHMWTVDGGVDGG